MAKKGQLYRARKAIEWKFTRGWTHKRIAEELDVSVTTVSDYVNNPPEELQEPVEHFKKELTLATFSRLREQLAEANRRARNAERPEKVFEYDDDGNLRAVEIPLESGGSKWVPKVKGMEMKPDQKSRYFARQEEREIIEMLWRLAGVEEPAEHKIEHEGIEVTSEVVTVTEENVNDDS